MQQELVRMVAERTGMPEDKARAAAETVIGYLRDKLPAPIAGQLDNFTGGASGSSASGGSSAPGGGIGSAIGGMASDLTGNKTRDRT